MLNPYIPKKLQEVSFDDGPDDQMHLSASPRMTLQHFAKAGPSATSSMSGASADYSENLKERLIDS